MYGLYLSAIPSLRLVQLIYFWIVVQRKKTNKTIFHISFTELNKLSVYFSLPHHWDLWIYSITYSYIFSKLNTLLIIFYY